MVWRSRRSIIVLLQGFSLRRRVALSLALVRLILVPSTMELLGKANWWLPRWMARILPRVPLVADAEPAADGASRITELARAQPAGRVADFGGPELLTLDDMARTWRQRGLFVP